MFCGHFRVTLSSHTPCSIRDSSLHTSKSYRVYIAHSSVYSVKSYTLFIAERFYLHCQIIHILITDSSLPLHSQVIHHALLEIVPSTLPSLTGFILHTVPFTLSNHTHFLGRQFFLHCQVILVQGCHIANIPFTQSSYTELSYCKQSIYTTKSYMVVILRTIHLHCQVKLVHGCHIANNPFTLSSHTWLSYCEQSIYTVK